jgi:predicted anti-sigma-YlaC factor YlaD
MDGGRIERVMSALMWPWVATHAETQKHLSEHLEGELAGREHKRVLRHLARCPRCREMLRSLAHAVEHLRQLGRGDDLPSRPSVADAVVDRIRHEAS